MPRKNHTKPKHRVSRVTSKGTLKKQLTYVKKLSKNRYEYKRS